MQSPKRLEAKWHINFPEGYNCRFINSVTERNVLHYHDYFEFFLTQTDGIEHHVNGTCETLRSGALVFVRPKDVHIYTKESGSYSFINFAFCAELADDVFTFLGKEIDIEKMLKSATPPRIFLQKTERRAVEALFNHLNCIPDKDTNEKRLQAKYILTVLFSKYFSGLKNSDTKKQIPLWLSHVYEQMQKPENFQAGIPAMVKLSNKSYEHLSRSMKKYYNVNITQYINSLRLNYAANMIKNTNYSLTDICFECGFNSTSYFSSCFKKNYGISPTEYRMQINS